MLTPTHLAGATSTLINFLVGSSRIKGRVTIDDTIMKKTCACANSNRIVFGANSNEPTAPTSVQKLLLVLVVARKIGYIIEKSKTRRDGSEYIYR